MKPKLDVITLAVDDLEESLAFYRDGLGFPTKGIVATEFQGTETEPAGAVAFFQLQGGLMLALYPRKELAKDAKLPGGVSSSLEFSLGHIVRSRKEVTEVLERAQAAGGTITDPARDRPWGIHSGYVKDLDGHLWEIIWHPKLSLDQQGSQGA